VTIYTVGHSTRPFDEFLRLLQAHGIEQLADVRTVPRSRRHPQFARETLDAALASQGITYRHFPALGGLRRPRPDSPNGYWRNESFRGYADHMQTTAFDAGVSDLLQFSAAGQTVVMCAEAVWWRCHRSLLADALRVRGVTVCHILSQAPAQPHQLCEYARTEGTTITYPGDTRSKPETPGNRKPTTSV
jgi:uncharacterized protein (DUF488 family)